MTIRPTIPVKKVVSEEYQKAVDLAFRERMLDELRLWSEHKSAVDEKAWEKEKRAKAFASDPWGDGR